MKMARLNYRFDENGVAGVDVGFEDYTNGAVQYSITVKLTPEDSDLEAAIPSQLAEVARAKAAQLLTGDLK